MMFDYVIILWLHVCRLPSSFVSPTMYFAKCLLNSIISISIYLSSDCRHTLNNDYAGLFSIHGSIWVCMIECVSKIFFKELFFWQWKIHSKIYVCTHFFHAGCIISIFQTISVINCTRKKLCVYFLFLDSFLSNVLRQFLCTAKWRLIT